MKKLLYLFLFATVLLLTACGGNGNDKQTAEDVIQAFKDKGLEIGSVEELENKEFGDTREEGKRILIPSLGEDAGGRLFLFKDSTGLEKAKSYYVELGESGPLFYSHTHEKGLFLLQMNGDMEDADFEKYAKVMDETVK